ncbi:hypothetical protein EVAR_63092_1 [Eumeta japonica]|uniref:Uncharacterized protein n=1 Tax=Eumeta variegata TaxID=151549 RepID=A0A4C2A0D3_EUMVA|nr:hypothetical protein EVAR_63092_1 [Eumeta japonica]
MKRLFSKEKESGAEGRKRRKLQEEAAQKSSKYFKKYLDLEKSTTGCSAVSKELPTTSTSTCTIKSEVSDTNSALNKEEEDINLNDSECDEIKISEATSSKTIEKIEKKY